MTLPSNQIQVSPDRKIPVAFFDAHLLIYIFITKKLPRALKA